MSKLSYNFGKFKADNIEAKNSNQKYKGLVTIFFSYQKQDFPSKNIKNN